MELGGWEEKDKNTSEWNSRQFVVCVTILVKIKCDKSVRERKILIRERSVC